MVAVLVVVAGWGGRQPWTLIPHFVYHQTVLEECHERYNCELLGLEEVKVEGAKMLVLLDWHGGLLTAVVVVVVVVGRKLLLQLGELPCELSEAELGGMKKTTVSLDAIHQSLLNLLHRHPLRLGGRCCRRRRL